MFELEKLVQLIGRLQELFFDEGPIEDDDFLVFQTFNDKRFFVSVPYTGHEFSIKFSSVSNEPEYNVTIWDHDEDKDGISLLFRYGDKESSTKIANAIYTHIF